MKHDFSSTEDSSAKDIGFCHIGTEVPSTTLHRVKCSEKYTRPTCELFTRYAAQLSQTPQRKERKGVRQRKHFILSFGVLFHALTNHCSPICWTSLLRTSSSHPCHGDDAAPARRTSLIWSSLMARGLANSEVHKASCRVGNGDWPWSFALAGQSRLRRTTKDHFGSHFEHRIHPAIMSEVQCTGRKLSLNFSLLMSSFDGALGEWCEAWMCARNEQHLFVIALKIDSHFHSWRFICSPVGGHCEQFQHHYLSIRAAIYSFGWSFFSCCPWFLEALREMEWVTAPCSESSRTQL